MAYFLMGFLKVNLPVRPYTHWVGMYYKSRRKEWNWPSMDEMTYENWEVPRYHVDNSGVYNPKCGMLDTRTFRFRETLCLAFNSYICWTKASSSGGCPPHYSSLGRGQGCLREGRNMISNQWEKVPLYNVQGLCRDRKGTILTIKNESLYNAVKEHLENRDKIWLGLVKNKGDNSYVWMNGKMTSYTNWAKDKDQRAACTSMDAYGLWHDEGCEESVRFVCQKHSDVGPMDLEMRVRFHLPTHSFFLGQQIEATCSVLGAENDYITWETADHVTSKMVYIHDNVSLHTAPTHTASGKCLTISVSKLTMTATAALHGLHLMCFAYEPPAQHICDGSLSDPPSFCAVSEVINIIDGPKGPPEVTHNFERPPAQIRHGHTLRLTCRVYPGKDEGTLIWIWYTRSGYREIKRPDGLIKSCKRVITDRGPSIVSVLEFSALDALHNTSIACFAYDVFTHISYIDCEPDDRYCHRTDPITVLPKGDEDSSWFTFIASPLLLLILLALYWPIKWCGQPDHPPGPEGAGSLLSPTAGSMASSKSTAFSEKSRFSSLSKGRNSLRQSLQE